MKSIPKTRHDSTLVYERPSGGLFYSPFTLTTQPMERLFRVDFGGDPTYRGIELQVIDNAGRGKGLLVIMYRRDRKVDVYFEPGLRPDSGSYDIEAGLREWVDISMARTWFDVTDHGAQVDVAFDDVRGRRVEVLVREHESTWPRKPFPLLAPVGSGIDAPTRFLLVFLHRFYLVRRGDTEMTIRIGGEERKPASLPLPIDRAFVYLARYSAEPFIAEWNKAHDGPLTPAEPPGTGEFQWEGATYSLVENAGRFETARITAADDRHKVDLAFSPPFPDILCLKHGAAVSGDFRLVVDDVHEICAGQYWLSREDEKIYLTLDIVDGWHPREMKLSTRLMFLLMRSFKNWPKTYKWSARFTIAGDELAMESAWSRK